MNIWPNSTPATCPFKESPDFLGLAFTGRHAEYTGADTWYPSWASDGNLYSPWTDGKIEASEEEYCSSNDLEKTAQTGQAKILGDDPLQLQVVSLGKYPGRAEPYGGRYPCGSLVHDGIWYHGSYCLDDGGIKPNYWQVMGPFVGFRVSRDLGLTWTDCPLNGHAPLFGESAKNNGKVKIGAPHFVDYGKNMEHSPDGKAYLVGHGAVRANADNSWVSGDQAYLIRVTPSPESINDRSQYEYFAGYDAKSNPLWSHDFAAIKPIMQWEDNAGCVTMTWNHPLKKYFMCVTYGGTAGGYQQNYDSYLLESDAITGPWRLVTYLKDFGPQGYFVNLPSKFISRDGLTMWLCYSGNWQPKPGSVSNPPGTRYALCLQEIQLQGRNH